MAKGENMSSVAYRNMMTRGTPQADAEASVTAAPKTAVRRTPPKPLSRAKAAKPAKAAPKSNDPLEDWEDFPGAIKFGEQQLPPVTPPPVVPPATEPVVVAQAPANPPQTEAPPVDPPAAPVADPDEDEGEPEGGVGTLNAGSGEDEDAPPATDPDAESDESDAAKT